MIASIKRATGALFLATCIGCVDSATMISVNKDGSGEIIQRTYYSAAASSMMKGFGGQENPDATAGFDEKAYRELVAELGEGVTYASGAPASKADGSSGFQVKYTFEDINKVRLPMMLDVDEDEEEEEEEAGTEKSVLTFDYDKRKAELVIHVPHKNVDKAGTAKAGDLATDDVDSEFDLSGGQHNPMAAMMGPMLQGMRMRTYVRINGDIAESNATYVNTSRQTGKKQLVTIMDMDIGKLLSDPVKMKKLESLGEMDDPVKGAMALQEFPEVKYELQKEVRVRFK